MQMFLTPKDGDTATHKYNLGFSCATSLLSFFPRSPSQETLKPQELYKEQYSLLMFWFTFNSKLHETTLPYSNASVTEKHMLHMKDKDKSA